MKQFVKDFFAEFAYPAEAEEQLLRDLDAIYGCEETKNAFEGLLSRYEAAMDCDIKQLITEMQEISAKAGIHEYAGALLLIVCLSKTLQRYHAEAGFDRGVWHDIMEDLKWKLFECREVYGIWGTFVPWWFPLHMTRKIFACGRLQFERVRFGRTYEKNGVVLTPETPVLSVHIPRTMTRLDPESVADAYEKAAAFFRKHFPEEYSDTVVFVCHSWLLFPRNLEVLSEKANLRQFIEGFEILEDYLAEDYHEVWRLFDKNYEGDPDALPCDTSLRRAYVNWMKNGEKIGGGYGIRIYEK